MVISIGADHGGLDLKNDLLNYLNFPSKNNVNFCNKFLGSAHIYYLEIRKDYVQEYFILI